MRMVKICGETLVKPLTSIFQFSLDTGRFPSKLKWGNVVPIHKNGKKMALKIVDQNLFSKYLVNSMKDVSMIHYTFTLKENTLFASCKSSCNLFMKITYEVNVFLGCCPIGES